MAIVRYRLYLTLSMYGLKTCKVMTELPSTTFVQGNMIARLIGKELMMKTVAEMRSSNVFVQLNKINIKL
jgi:hypothetical protein